MRISREAETHSLFFFGALALAIESCVVFLVGNPFFAFKNTRSSILNQPHPEWVEAKLYSAPPRLLTHKAHEGLPKKRQDSTLLSKSNLQKKTPLTLPSPTVEENQVESAPPLPVDHGPILVYGPSPEIPASLQTQEINTSVGIQFLIDSSGRVQAQLTTSSGNEELDAIALETLKKWVFRPAQKDGKPIDSKIKSQIHFLVN